jgi:hypothetical protein
MALLVAHSALAWTSAIAQQPPQRWFRGNTHTHTLNSDGDSPPDVVVRWYREHDYDFLFVTDHEFITDVRPLNGLFGAAGRFLVISGQEVTQRVRETGQANRVLQPHVNALGVEAVVWPLGERAIATGVTIAQTYARNLSEIRRAGGVAQINHPNFAWSVPLAELVDVPDSTLFEIWNGNPNVHNAGGVDSVGTAHGSAEELWDGMLSRGRTIWGVADDDSHSFAAARADDPEVERPGRGWIMVRADTLTEEAVLAALRRGDFYASTGISLRDYRVEARAISIQIVPFRDRTYLTEFIGEAGKLLARAYGTTARYPMTGAERYVRARITDSAGRRAWTQPVRPGG